ncbi:hypothetical protein Fmac_013347 [Flemingia macrophylla]|uniref:Uncharacterized protein n=1 Tax=Flemingia macrophylla TaxID=520843 RepID=A0ABD1MSV6_9FABA
MSRSSPHHLLQLHFQQYLVVHELQQQLLAPQEKWLCPQANGFVSETPPLWASCTSQPPIQTYSLYNYKNRSSVSSDPNGYAVIYDKDGPGAAGRDLQSAAKIEWPNMFEV